LHLLDDANFVYQSSLLLPSSNLLLAVPLLLSESAFSVIVFFIFLSILKKLVSISIGYVLMNV